MAAFDRHDVSCDLHGGDLGQICNRHVVATSTDAPWIICHAGHSRCSKSRRSQVLNFLFVLAVGLVAGTVSGIVGTGSSIMLMPVLVYQYGPKQAVPIMAVAAGVAKFSRILAWGDDVDWRGSPPPFCSGGSAGAPCAPGLLSPAPPPPRIPAR